VSLSPERRDVQNPQHIWRCFSAARQKKKPYHRRLHIDEAAALRAHADAKLAMRDVARRKGYEISENELIELAEAAFVAILNSLDIVVPENMRRKITTAVGKRGAIHKNGTGAQATAR